MNFLRQGKKRLAMNETETIVNDNMSNCGCSPSGYPKPNNECCTDIPEYTRFAYSSAQSAFANAENAQQSAEDAATTLANVVQKTGDTMTGGLVIDVTSPNTALRVTQQGTGISFVVEDELHPDVTPFQIDAAGNVSIGTNTTAEKLTVVGGIQASGAIRTSSSAFGVGYSTGAGGTQTQLTNKATAVALNRPCGQITLNNATLNADTTVSFIFNNSTIAAGDVLVLNHISGGTIGSYLLNAQSAAGSATINVRNITAGNLGEAIVIAFAVIKAVTT
jgi:hypothetical protein